MSKEGNKTRHIGAFSKKNKKNQNDSNGKNYLLAIAIDEYEHCPKLSNAVKDARDLIAVLTERYQFENENVTTLINEKATEENILHTFRQLAGSITSDDNLIIFFSGHGEYDTVFREGYWVPVNAQQGAIQDYVPNSKIKTVLNAIRSRHTFLIIDSCFSGSLFMQYRSSGLAERLERDPSRWGLTAGRNEIVADGEAGGNSPFADSLIYHLRHSKTSVGVSDLCNKVMEDVIANANQTPRGEPLKVEGHRGGQFFFHLKGHVPTTDQTTHKSRVEPAISQPGKPLRGKKKSMIPYFVGGLAVLLFLVFMIPKLLKKDPPKEVNNEELTQIETNQTELTNSNQSEKEVEKPVKDRIKNRREKNTDNQTETPKTETHNTPSAPTTAQVWKETVLPWLEKGEAALKRNPPDLNKAEEYFKTALETADENGLDTEKVRQYFKLIEQKKAELAREKEAARPKYGTITDRRDGKKYKTINLFGKDWMAEDLKYEMPNGNSFCYNDDASYCAQYGRFYTWEDAKKACPLGWRMPTYEEWRRMILKFGGPQYALPKLASGGETGFNVLLSGERSTRGTWHNLEQVAEYWTSYQADGKRVYGVNFSNIRGDRAMIYYPKAEIEKNYFSCRCIKK